MDVMVGMATVDGFLLAKETPSVVVPKISPAWFVVGFSVSATVCCVLRTSSPDQTIRPSMPPSTEMHCPEMWPAARWLARNAAALATSVGCAIFRNGTLHELVEVTQHDTFGSKRLRTWLQLPSTSPPDRSASPQSTWYRPIQAPRH